MAEQINGGAIKEIERIVQGGQRSTILEVPDEPAGVYYLVGANGNAERKVAAPDWHGEKLAAPAELRSFIEHQKRDTSAVFLEDGAAVFVYELEDRRHKAVCLLPLTEQYRWIFPEAQRFALTPYPLQTRKALDQALQDIEELLSAESDAGDMPKVFRGKPE